MTCKSMTVLLGLAALSFTSASAQDDEEESDEPLRCLSMNSIRSTVVVDDSRVLFFQARDRVFSEEGTDLQIRPQSLAPRLEPQKGTDLFSEENKSVPFWRRSPVHCPAA